MGERRGEGYVFRSTSMANVDRTGFWDRLPSRSKAAGGEETEKLPWDMREFLTRTLEDYITNPITQHQETLLACVHLWNAISIVRAIMHKYATGTDITDFVAREREFKLLQSTCDGAMQHVRAIRKAIQEAKETLPQVLI
jgi:hypothetical protein